MLLPLATTEEPECQAEAPPSRLKLHRRRGCGRRRRRGSRKRRRRRTKESSGMRRKPECLVDAPAPISLPPGCRHLLEKKFPLWLPSGRRSMPPPHGGARQCLSLCASTDCFFASRQDANDGGGELHHFHQEQHPLPPLQLHQVRQRWSQQPGGAGRTRV